MRSAPDKLWWTVDELADAGLPDLPGSKRGINVRAEQSGWRNKPGCMRRRTGRGGGFEYHWSVLPQAAQRRLLAETAPALPEAPDAAQVWAEFEALQDNAKASAQARLGIIQEVDVLCATGLGLVAAVTSVAERNKVSPRTVHNWLALIDGVALQDRLACLAPRHQKRGIAAARAEIDPDFAAMLKSDYLRQSGPSFRSCYDRTVTWAEAEGVATVPLHTARRWYKRTVSKAVEVLGRKGLQALKQLYPAQIRDRSALGALGGVNGDYHKFDVFVRFPTPDGDVIQRPQMVAFQDLYSNKFLAWRLSHSANSHTVQLCLGDMIEHWGIPEHVLLDNGREFAALAISGGSETRNRWRHKEDDIPGLLTTLGCTIHWATPYSGQSKPIERAFRDLCDRVARHPAFEGAYTGNKPDAKPENYGNRAIPLDEFTTVLNAEMHAHNARPDRRSDVAFGRSFDDVFAESYARGPIRKASAGQRRLWLLGAEGVQVARTGRVTFMGNGYFDDFLHGYIGQKVVIRYDDADLWNGVHVYALSGSYLGHAPCTEKVGFFSADGGREIKRLRGRFTKATKEALEAQRKLSAAEVAARAVSAMPEPPAGSVAAQVISLPKHTAKAPRPSRRTAEDAPHPEVKVTALPQRATSPGADVGDERERFARAMALEARLDQGGALTVDQGNWLRAYQKHPEYAAQMEIREAFKGRS